jgi:chitosanase
MATISSATKDKILRIINVFETGSEQGNYSDITKLKDGPGGIKQVTYGRSQTTEFGNLKRLVETYIANNGSFADGLKAFVNKIGKMPSLVDNTVFCQLLKDAGANDPIMKTTQDEFFDRHYYFPAFVWFEGHGFTEPLSLLVIYDSFIHSGSIRKDIREKFSEKPPAFGGNERTWIKQYVEARHNWLLSSSRAVVRGTVYRTKCFKTQIANANWDLVQPVTANGRKVV